nr:DUF2764 family protein [Allomuricauda sp.]
MISGNLEYLMSSLPYLSYQDTDEERSKVFSTFKKYAGLSERGKSVTTILDNEASKYLGAKKSELLQQISLEHIHQEVFRQTNTRVLAAFSAYMYVLKKELQQLRISRKEHKEASPTKKSALPLVPGTPLEEEIQILKWQWEKLEELSIEHYADFEALVLYKLKLLLLIRLWSFDQEQGFENFLNITK